MIDGAVVKLTDMRTREVLGYTDKFPRWAVAFKFEAEENDNDSGVGIMGSRSYRQNNTARASQPVELAGVTVQNCTLNNVGDIERKNLKHALGTHVFIRRSNDVIPEILGKADDEPGEEIIIPNLCPACGSELRATRRAFILLEQAGLPPANNRQNHAFLFP